MSKTENQTTQIPIEFEKNISFKKEDFILSPSNEKAFDDVFHLPWLSHGLIVLGEKSSGKTHLLNIWSDDVRATVLGRDDILSFDFGDNETPPFIAIDKVDQFFGEAQYEEKLFHLYNSVKELGGKILFTTQVEPVSWQIKLPDLSSRLKSLQVTKIGSADEFLLKAVLLKLFSDRQIQVGMDVIDYAIPRIDRSMATLVHFVQVIDETSLSEKRNITVPFVKKILDSL